MSLWLAFFNQAFASTSIINYAPQVGKLKRVCGRVEGDCQAARQPWLSSAAVRTVACVWLRA
jgi:hypothetical protein